MSAFKDALAQAAHITVVAGAGLSAASGIPTFRGAGGFWRRYDAMSLARPEAFAESPSRVWQFYEYRRRKALAAKPNDAHRALARFADPEQRRAVAPNCRSFSFITQNVDGLSSRALAEAEQSQSPQRSPIYEMHGSIAEPYCTRCNDIAPQYDDVPIVPALADIVEVVDTSGPEAGIPSGDLPHCASCGGMLRPGVVWFGEMPRYLDEIDAILRKTELLLVVGTSSTVYPAAGFASRVKARGGRVAVFNMERSDGDEEADFLLLGPCEKTLPAALSSPSL